MKPACAAIVALFLPLSLSAQAAEDESLARARAILDERPLVDTHNDLPWVIREKLGGDVESHDISIRAAYDTDIPRLREGGVGVQFWSVYVPSNLEPFDAMRSQLEQIDIARRIVDGYPDDLGWAESVEDIEKQLAAGRIASLIGIEGLHTMGNSLGALRTYYDLGVRYATLTHFNSNDWADAATEPPQYEGLTKFGEEVVREMNRLGMMVDISHVSPDAMADTLDVTEAPIFFSHSSALSLTGHVRNVPDEILERMPDNGGVVMVAFIPPFVSEPARLWAEGLFPLLQAASTDAEWQTITKKYVAENGKSPRATVSDVADHIEHIADVAGVDHVGIGADYYGTENENMIVQGLEDVSKYPGALRRAHPARLERRGPEEARRRQPVASIPRGRGGRRPTRLAQAVTGPNRRN